MGPFDGVMLSICTFSMTSKSGPGTNVAPSNDTCTEVSPSARLGVSHRSSDDDRYVLSASLFPNLHMSIGPARNDEPTTKIDPDPMAVPIDGIKASIDAAALNSNKTP
jgi:hypothetical protein